MADVFKIVLGALFGFFCSTALAPAMAGLDLKGAGVGIATGILVIGGMTAGYYAPTVRRAFGRGFLALGACLLFLPISAFMLAGRAFNDTVSAASVADQGAAAVGAGIGAVAITGAATFFGLILGLICVIIGLVFALGGQREVVIVQR